jgi:nematocidal protein AidA
MATIDILCVIDTNGLMKKNLKPGTLKQPTPLGSYGDSDTFVFMICDGQYASNDQGKSELTVNALIGDTLRWTITDPSTGLNLGQTTHSYSCILYNFASGAINTGAITQPVLIAQPAVMYYNGSENDPLPAVYMCSAWTSTVLKPGSVQYSWCFQVINCLSGEVIGYYSWDPFINVAG